MKRIIKRFLLANLSIVWFTNNTTAQTEAVTSNDFFSFEASYLGDNINNLKGGIKQGSCYLGMASLRFGIDLNKAGIKGVEFFVNAANTHGTSPSSHLIGDMQVASNIDAGNHSFIQEFWIKKTFKTLELTLGLQDLNVEFANSSYGSLFLNSSFGILPVISSNFAAPIFPLTTIGFTSKWRYSDKATWILALYDGSPTDFDYNPYNLNWQFLSGDGLLAISELQYSIKINELEGIYKAGLYSHNHIVERGLSNPMPDSLTTPLIGFYAYTDQTIWHHQNKSIGLFSQMGYSPSSNCENDFYFGFGFNYSGIFSKEGLDILGFACAHQKLSKQNKSETSFELSYRYQLTKNIFLQPDIQYIVNPSGTTEKLKNSFVCSLRFGIDF